MGFTHGGGHVSYQVELADSWEIDMHLLHIVELVSGLFATGWIAWVIIADGRELRYHIRFAFRDLYRATYRQIRYWRKKYAKKELRHLAAGKTVKVNWKEVRYSFGRIITNLEEPYRTTRRFVGNLIYYMPFLWWDSWFDHSYLLAIIERKCRRDAKRYRQHGMAQNAGAIADELEMVATICFKLTNEFETYEEPAYYTHDLKWGAMTVNDQLLNKPRPNATTPELEEQEHAEFRALMEKVEKAKQRDCVHLGFLFMRCRYWWD